MKAFLSGVVVAILIGVAAGFILNELNWSSADVYSSEHGSVRL